MRWSPLFLCLVLTLGFYAPVSAQDGALSDEEWERTQWPPIAERICGAVSSGLCDYIRDHPGWVSLSLNRDEPRRVGLFAIPPAPSPDGQHPADNVMLRSAPNPHGEPYLTLELNVAELDPLHVAGEHWVAMEDPRRPGHPPTGLPMMYGELSFDGEIFVLRNAVFLLHKMVELEMDGLVRVYRLDGRLDGTLVRKDPVRGEASGPSYSLAGTTVHCLYIVDRHAGAIFREFAPEYIKAQIPPDPGHISIVALSASDGELPALHLGFLGTAQVYDRPATKGIFPAARLASPPTGRMRFGLEFYPGAGLRWGVETKIAITEENRYTPNRSLGTIRVWAGVDAANYEVEKGQLTISVFHRAPLPAESQLAPGVRLQMWRLRGVFSGQLVRSDPGASSAAPLRIKDAGFDCLMIQDIAPVPGGDGQADIWLERYMTDRLTLRETLAHLEQIDDETWLLDLRAETGRGGDDRYGFHFQAWSKGQIGLPLVARYTVNTVNRGLPERFLRVKPPGTLVMSWTHHPQPDLQLHYWPEEATMRIEESYLMLRTGGLEYWRLKGTFAGTFEYYKKIDPIDPATELQRDRVEEIDRFAITRGTFDVVLTRQVSTEPRWQDEFPGMPDPTVGGGD